VTSSESHCHAGRCARMGRCGPGLCDPCRRLAGQWLAELPGLVAELSDGLPEAPDVAHSPAGLVLTAGPVRASTGPRVSGSGETPLPGGADRLSWLARAADVHGAGRLDADCQTGTTPIAAELAGWVKLAAEELGVTVPRVGRLTAGPDGWVRRTASVDVPALCRFLSVQHDRICARPWADDYAEAVYDLWVWAMTRTGRFDGRPEPMDGVACPFCDRMALVRVPGEAGRTCDRADGGCGKWLSDDEYERWTRMEDHSVRQTTMIRYEVWDRGDLRTGLLMTVETEYDRTAHQWVATSDDDGRTWVGRADTHQGAHLALLADRLGFRAEVTMPPEPDAQAEQEEASCR